MTLVHACVILKQKEGEDRCLCSAVKQYVHFVWRHARGLTGTMSTDETEALTLVHQGKRKANNVNLKDGDTAVARGLLRVGWHGNIPDTTVGRKNM